MPPLTKIELVSNTQEMPRKDDLPVVGRWYWTMAEDRCTREITRSLGCVMHLGSNYVSIHYVNESHSPQRFHVDVFDGQSEQEGDPGGVIEGEVDRCRARVRQLMEQVMEVTKRLAVSPLAHAQEAHPESQALSTISSGLTMEDYKTSLVRAKDETLPDLFRKVKAAHEEMRVWMLAHTLPLSAATSRMYGAIHQVESRIFSLDLYAGVTEQVVQFAEGDPPPCKERLRVMQRLCYMDEECLAQYRSGGMDFQGIDEFDAWLAEPENRDRILPFPRCMVSFRVRRRSRGREYDGTLHHFIEIRGQEAEDRNTFLYLRNGKNLYRLQTGLNFGEKLFPNHGQSLFSGELLARMSGSRVVDLVPRRTYDQMVEDDAKRVKADAAERAAREARGERPWTFLCGPDPCLKRYVPFTPDSVYHDEISAHISAEITKYNRIVLIIQGLYDRSSVFKPHPPVKTWSGERFDQAIQLVFDSDYALYAGDKPDFQAYFDRLNKLLKPGDLVIGQEALWLQKEAGKENGRNAKYDFHTPRYKEFKPYGNPGPGFLSTLSKLTKRYATFQWTRMRVRGPHWDPSKRVPEILRVDPTKLFNVSAYKPGDFKQFFADPRTRDEYIKWAPLLLSAEDYYAGRLKVGGCE